jgi:hypothetical protein
MLGAIERGHVGAVLGGARLQTESYQGLSIQSRRPKKEIIQMGSKAKPSDSSPTVSPNELLMNQVVSNEVLLRLLIKKGIITKEEFFEMVEKVNLDMARMV